jgi:hypothetical protein
MLAGITPTNLLDDGADLARHFTEGSSGRIPPVKREDDTEEATSAKTFIGFFEISIPG